MATNYTEHYGFCQWEPTDPFVRVEFNEDNKRVDAGLAGLRRETEQVREALVPYERQHLFSRFAALL